jgi:large subunit ribosomal protein L21
MYAVIQAGGRQYKVVEGDTISVDYFEAPVGAEVTFDRVLMTGGEATAIGKPLVDGASGVGAVTEPKRGPKHLLVKRRRRKDSRVKRGFRSHLTDVRIDKIIA